MSMNVVTVTRLRRVITPVIIRIAVGFIVLWVRVDDFVDWHEHEADRQDLAQTIDLRRDAL